MIPFFLHGGAKWFSSTHSRLSFSVPVSFLPVLYSVLKANPPGEGLLVSSWVSIMTGRGEANSGNAVDLEP